jgi:hypothetical protein
MSQPPWATEPGLSQVVCGCLSETFTFLVSDVAVRLVCARCGQVNGELTRPPGWEPFRETAGPDAEYRWGRDAPRLTGPPPLPAPPQVYATWVDDLPPDMQRDMLPIPEPPTIGELDPLRSRDALPGPQQASPEHANVVLDGGPYTGWLLALPRDVTTLSVAGHAYRATDARDADGRRVFAWYSQGT